MAGGYEVDFMTFSLEWLARWLLSFGRATEVLAPAKLRSLMRTEAAAVVARHSNKDKEETLLT